MIEVVHYLTEGGRDPFDEWLSRQNVHVVAACCNASDRMRRGNFGDHKRLGGGVAELRIGYGPGFRLYCGLDGRDLVVLLTAGTKMRQSRDIDRARSLWRAYREEKR